MKRIEILKNSSKLIFEVIEYNILIKDRARNSIKKIRYLFFLISEIIFLRFDNKNIPPKANIDKFSIKLKFINMFPKLNITSFWEIALKLGVIRKIKIKKDKGLKIKIGNSAKNTQRSSFIKIVVLENRISIKKGDNKKK